MLDLNLEADAQLNCLDACIEQLTADYKKMKSAQELSRRYGDPRHADHQRKQSQLLMNRLTYLLRERSKAEGLAA